MFQVIRKGLLSFIALISMGFYLAACGGGGGGGGNSPAVSSEGTSPSLQSATVTGVLSTESNVASTLISLISPAVAVANVATAIYLDDSREPIFTDSQDRFTITNIPNGDHSLYLYLANGDEIVFPFRMEAGRGLDFGAMTIEGGRIDSFTGFDGYTFGWLDEDGDGINDNFADVDGDGICDQGHHYAGYAYRMGSGYVDNNNDGFNDRFVDADGDGVNDLTGQRYGFGFGFTDEDNDGINDYFVDANGDGICDLSGMPYQQPFGWSDGNGDGFNDHYTDADGDGINDLNGSRYVAMPGWVDLNEDGFNDFFADTNGDGINDLGGGEVPYGHGFGWVDENNDGVNDRFVDEDGDGINDIASGPFAGQCYCYGFMENYVDANGDGFDDESGLTYRHGFGWVDNNGDGINDYYKDAEGDGVNDYYGYQYVGGYRYSQDFSGPMRGSGSGWPMGPGAGMMKF